MDQQRWYQATKYTELHNYWIVIYGVGAWWSEEASFNCWSPALSLGNFSWLKIYRELSWNTQRCYLVYKNKKQGESNCDIAALNPSNQPGKQLYKVIQRSISRFQVVLNLHLITQTRRDIHTYTHMFTATTIMYFNRISIFASYDFIFRITRLFFEWFFPVEWPSVVKP